MRTLTFFLAAAVVLADVTHARLSQDEFVVQPGENQVAVFNILSQRWELCGGGWSRDWEPRPNAIYCDGRYLLWGSRHDADESISVFDVRRRAWDKIEKPPCESRSFYSAAVQGNRFAVWGGTRDSNTSLANGALYDFAVGRWSKLPDAPLQPRTASGMAWGGRRLFVWGGYTLGGGNGYAADGAVFDLATGSWKKASKSGLEGRTLPMVIAVKNRFFVWGGFGEQNWYADGSLYFPESDTWEKIPTSPLRPRSGCGAAVLGSRVYLFFGDGVGEDHKDAAYFDSATRRWKALGDAPIESRHDPAVAVSGGKIYVWGGINHAGGRVRDAAVLDPRTDRWHRIEDIPFTSSEDRVFYR